MLRRNRESYASPKGWRALIGVSSLLLTGTLTGVMLDLKFMAVQFALLLSITSFFAGYLRRAYEEAEPERLVPPKLYVHRSAGE
jgi:hypothetical protein